MRFESREGLLAWLIGRFAQEFRHEAILKGGMVLRLLDSPRSTNDADFVFVPRESRKDILSEVKALLDGIEGLKWKHRIDSRALRLQIWFGGQVAQVEITAAKECRSFPLSTGTLAHAHGFAGGIVRVMDLSVALSNKLSAWNERRLWRDVHDLWFLHSVRRTAMDFLTLDARLAHVERRRGKPISMTRQELASALRKCAADIEAKDVIHELADTLPPEDLVGIEVRLATAMGRLATVLEESVPG